MAKSHILLVEDNAADVDLTREFLENRKIRNNIFVVKDGVEALAYLRCEGKYSQATRPALILLDLNTPEKNGHEVLEEIRKDPKLSDIPVVILTTPQEEADLVKAHNLRASHYVTKPLDATKLFQIIQFIDCLAIEIVETSELTAEKILADAEESQLEVTNPGIKAFRAGDYKTAIEKLSNLIEENSNLWQCRFFRALAFFAASDATKAADELKNITEWCPDRTLREKAEVVLIELNKKFGQRC